MPKAYTPNDKLSQMARKMGFRARSIFKLEEIDQKFPLFSTGQKVLDIGAAPGSWLQYVSAKIGTDGLAIGIDLKPISPIAKNIKTFIGDINLDSKRIRELFKTYGVDKFDIILSDIAPNTTGIPYADQKRSVDLSQNVVDVAKKHLKSDGIIVMKVFSGEHFEKFLKTLYHDFRYVKTLKLKASRDRSKEVYVICKGIINNEI